MADIKQAAKWMQEGKAVRRPYFVPGKTLFGPYGVVYGVHGTAPKDNEWAEFHTQDLLANDWEVSDGN